MAAQRQQMKDQVLELVQFFRQNSLAVTTEDLEKPAGNRVWPIYSWFVRQLTDCPDQVLTQPGFATLQMLENPELHTLSGSVITLALCLDRILDDAGYTEGFYVRDLLKPTNQKTVRVMHYLFRYYRSRCARLLYVQNRIAQLNDMKGEAARLEAANSQLKERIGAARMRLAEEKEQGKQLKERDDKLSEDVQEKKNKIKSVEKYAKQLEQDVEAAQAASKLAKAERDRLEDEALRLDSQIVTSPERLVTDVNSLESEKERLEKEMEEAGVALANDNDRKAGFDRIASMLDSVSTPLDETMTRDKEEWESMREKHSKLVDQRNNLEFSIQGAKAKREMNLKAMEAVDKRYKTTEEQMKFRFDELKEKIGQIEKQLGAANPETRENLIIAELEKQLEEARRNDALLEDEHAKNKRRMFDAMTQVSQLSADRHAKNRQFFKTLNGDISKELKK